MRKPAGITNGQWTRIIEGSLYLPAEQRKTYIQREIADEVRRAARMRIYERDAEVIRRLDERDLVGDL